MKDTAMKKLLLTALTLVMVVAGATVAFGVVGDDDTSRAGTTTTMGEDVSGPCDEAEHANDPRCNGEQADDDHGDRGRDHAEDNDADDNDADDNGDDDAGEDVSGPCDEAEHANDPQCTGTAPAPGTSVDNSGPGSVNSGPGSINSGPGNAEDVGDDDSSGPGPGGDDDGFDDGGSSGPGGGDDDSSGHGSGDDD